LKKRFAAVGGITAQLGFILFKNLNYKTIDGMFTPCIYFALGGFGYDWNADWADLHGFFLKFSAKFRKNPCKLAPQRRKHEHGFRLY
jgi:hypothetical protein